MAREQARDGHMDLVTRYGEEILLKEKDSLLAGEILDGMFRSQ